MNDAVELLDVIKSTAADVTGVSMLYGTAKSEAAGTSCMVQLDGSNTSQSVKTLAKPKVNDRVAMLLADKRLTVIGVLGGEATSDIYGSSMRDNFGYIRYADGRMEAWGYQAVTNVSVSDLWGNMRCSGKINLNMTTGFKTVNHCAVTLATKGASATLYAGGEQPNTTTMGSCYLVRPDSGTVPQANFHYHVIGTWK